jgi:hypothetical protein
MNWLERTRREIQECVRWPTANSAERNPTAVMAVPPPTFLQKLEGSIGSNGSTREWMFDKEAVREELEERAAIMEFNGGMSRDEAESEAWALVQRHCAPLGPVDVGVSRGQRFPGR